jgi:uncharacterized protein (TIGR03663 family)
MLALIVVLGFWLRTRDLERRPMHADEANQAVKLGELLEQGRYAFDPRDHHGPTLYYAAVPVAWIRGQRTLAALDETTIRLVPALFGTASILLLYALARNRAPDARAWPALAAAAFLAVSPPSVYYSRYFIQETLLVTFTLTALLTAAHWWKTHRLGWAVLFGVSAALMQATKASAPLFLVAAGGAFLLSRRPAHAPVDTIPADQRRRRRFPSLRFAVAGFLLTFVTFYSSFFTDFAGLRSAVDAYGHAFTRFGAEAPATGHEKPWWYYAHLFGWFRTGGLVWHQLAFAAVATLGFVLAFTPSPAAAPKHTFHRFVALYTCFIFCAFSFFAYKTPWHALHLIPGMALLAAAALAVIARLRLGGVLAAAAAVTTVVTLYQQAMRVAFLRPADQRNPYAYVHSAPDVLKYRARAEAAIAAAPNQPVRIISEEYWPLPWYLRGIPHVGFYTTPPDDCDGALVITSTTHVEDVRAKLKRKYTESFLGLRPGVVLILFTLDPTS